MKKSGLKREEIFLETKLWPAFYEQPDAVKRRFSAWTPVISTCCWSTSPRAITSPDTS